MLCPWRSNNKKPCQELGWQVNYLKRRNDPICVGFFILLASVEGRIQHGGCGEEFKPVIQFIGHYQTAPSIG